MELLFVSRVRVTYMGCNGVYSCVCTVQLTCMGLNGVYSGMQSTIYSVYRGYFELCWYISSIRVQSMSHLDGELLEFD